MSGELGNSMETIFGESNILNLPINFFWEKAFRLFLFCLTCLLSKFIENHFSWWIAEGENIKLQFCHEFPLNT
jgi:hypothetical protein